MVLVLGNLIGNGLKYSPADQPVTVSIDATADAVTIVVRDRGMGIPPAELACVGRRFYRATNARHVQGSGLGLRLVRTTLASQEGALEVASHPKGGTRVAVHLPAGGASRSGQ